MHKKVSLIAPVRDEESGIRSFLDSVFGQSRQPDEVVITDGGSRDKTKDIIRSYIDAGRPVVLVETGGAYPGTGRNLAIERATNDLIAMTDAGIRLDARWLESLIAPFEADEKTDVVYGNLEPAADTFFKRCLSIAFLPAKCSKGGRMMRPYSIASCAMKRSVWKAAGGFPDFRAAEDRIFMGNVEKSGAVIAFAPDATIYWEIPGGFMSVFRRFSTLSFHDLKAGRACDWHIPVARLYAGAAVLVLLGAIYSPVWFALLFVLALARAGRLIYRRSEEKSFWKKYSPASVFMVALLAIWIDLAMFAGSLRYVVASFGRRNGGTDQ